MELQQAHPHELVAEEVRALFARRQISARRVALSLGWTENYMSRRLTGKIPLDVNDLVALAGALDVPVTEFFAKPSVTKAQGMIMGTLSAPPSPATLATSHVEFALSRVA